MTCPFEATASDYLDGSCDPATRRAFDAHLSGCDHCATLLRELDLIRTTARTLARPALPAGAWRRIDAVLAAERRVANSAARVSRIRGWGTLAACAAAVLLAVVGSQDQASAPPEDADLDAVTYGAAFAGLEPVAIARAGDLDGDLALQLQQSLSAVDAAIGESRAVLRDMPDSDAARASLSDALATKVALLEDAVAFLDQMDQIPGTTAGIAAGATP